MKWLQNIRSIISRAIGGNDAEYLTGDPFGRTQYSSTSGETVSLLRAIGYPAFRQGVTLLSGDVAKLPFAPYKLSNDGTPELDRSHAMYPLTAWFPNEAQPAFYFWRHMMIHAIIFTHSYALIRRDGLGRAVAMYPLLSDRVHQTNDGTGYRYELDMFDGNGPQLFHSVKSNIFHLQSMCLGDGDDSVLLKECRDTIGLGLAANGFASRFFAKGGRSGGILEIPTALTAKAADTLEEGFRSTYEDNNNQFATVILRNNAKFHQANFDPDKSQMTLSRQEQVKEVARILNIPAHKLGHDGRTAYNSLEMEERSYLNNSLSHWLQAIRAEANLKLLTAEERRVLSHSFDHDVSEQLVADSETRASVGQKEYEMGAISPNEYRRRIKLPPREGGEEFNTAGGEGFSIFEAVQKLYLGVGPLLSAGEARQILQDSFGVKLDEDFEPGKVNSTFNEDGEEEAEEEVEEEGGDPAEPAEPDKNGDDAGPDERLLQATDKALRRAIEYGKRRVRAKVVREVKRKKPSRFVAWFDDRFDSCYDDYREEIREAAASYALTRGKDVSEFLKALVDDNVGALGLSLTKLLNTTTEGDLVEGVETLTTEWGSNGN